MLPATLHRNGMCPVQLTPILDAQVIPLKSHVQGGSAELLHVEIRAGSSEVQASKAGQPISPPSPPKHLHARAWH